MVAAATRRFGFVAFERKEDCQRALAMCGKNMFLIGNSARPVVVEMARTEVWPLTSSSLGLSCSVWQAHASAACSTRTL